jgi:hypothetical protein
MLIRTTAQLGEKVSVVLAPDPSISPQGVLLGGTYCEKKVGKVVDAKLVLEAVLGFAVGRAVDP